MPSNKLYTSLSIRKKSMKEYDRLHKQFGEHMNSIGFFDYLLVLCKESHCPECGAKQSHRMCQCKGPEAA